MKSIEFLHWLKQAIFLWETLAIDHDVALFLLIFVALLPFDTSEW